MTATMMVGDDLRQLARQAKETEDAAAEANLAEARIAHIAMARRELVDAIKRTLKLEIAVDDPRIVVREANSGTWDHSATALIELDGVLLTGRRSGYSVYVVAPCAACGEEAWNEVDGLPNLARTLEAGVAHGWRGCPEKEVEAATDVKPQPISAAEQLATAVLRIVQENASE